ncbi:TPA: prophage tail fiber N-terminal domain-containing protein [Escherichia coli]|nr:phage tail protein [Escherichia coli]HAI7799898.1 phage tail protein [Escherichia coli O25b:H4-ST131]EHM3226050.1 prophage tail fiber N-terminal domain-containing protein [Escherichia coli]ELC3617216.1 prophage tail fiber N-terminal domain-containing protein [Escherichia coli]ELN6765439.1 prophage tail fiber N-terminal domain-containing protein [Escherichia coli]
MAAVKISGVLKDGAGKPIQNCTIQLKAKRNSTTVLVNTVASENPDEAGRYSMDVEYGQYSVTLLVEGFPPSHAGTITVYEGSRPGTLNDFLGAMTEDDVMPEALRRFEEMVEEAARNAEAASQSAAAAKKSETAAASSKNAAKTSETNAANSAQAAAASQTASANSATAAKKSETNAKNSETAAKTSETNAKSSQTAAKTSETNAKASETAAKNSQVAAAESESAAAGSATSAAGSATAAANSQKAAKTSETNAKSSQTAAKTSETNAKASETAAKNSQDAAAQSESAAAGSATAAANSQKAAKTSETNAKTSETKAAASETEATSAATRAENAARIAEDAADPASVPPLPDIWLPLNDSLEAITGYAPGYKTITIGSDEITMPVNGICQFSRASSATYIDKSGHITVAGNNVPRFEKYGLLIENQRTNMFVNSFNPDAWNKSGGISVTSSTDEFEFKYGRFTVGSDIAGTTTGRNICTVAGNKGIDVTGDDQYSKGPYVTASFRVRSDLNVRARIRFERYNSEGYTFLCDAYLSLQTHELQITGGNAQLLTANFEIDPGSGWIYFQATLKCLPEWGMVGTQLQIAADRAVGSFATGDWIEVTTPQFEYGACATSFIITTTEPATRASDLCKFPLMKNMYTMPFTFMVEVHKNWFISHNAAPRVIDSENHQSGGPFIMGFGSSGTISQDGYSYCDIGGANRRVYESCGVRDLVMGFRVKADGMTCSFANKNISTETKTVWKYIREAAVIRIGGQTTTGLRHLNGHIKNLRFWNRALSDTQLKEYV